MDRVCVIGAGPCGITAAKNLLDAGFTDLVVYERGDRIGGNWVFDDSSGHSSVFETTHIISSRAYSQYDDFPAPPDWPDYPGHAQLAAYFQGYAKRFGVEERVRFGRTVVRCARGPEGWLVTTSDRAGVTETEAFGRLVVSIGHHSVPRWPEYPGQFTGTLLHSHGFKRAAPFHGQRVLVIGGGNSACDCAVETGRITARTDLSWRRGYWVVPKFLFGRPSDDIHNQLTEWLGFVPLSWRLRALEWVLRLINGPNRLYGLPEPDHHLGQTHPTLNSELLYAIRHGEVGVRPDIARFEGPTVHFVDGSCADYDAIIACTGFVIAHPFFEDPAFQGDVPLYLRMIPPDRDDLAFVGLLQPLGCVWPIAELQSKLLARWWTGKWAPPADRAAAIRRDHDHPDVRQVASPRHTITVDDPTFRKRLRRELAA